MNLSKTMLPAILGVAAIVLGTSADLADAETITHSSRYTYTTYTGYTGPSYTVSETYVSPTRVVTYVSGPVVHYSAPVRVVHRPYRTYSYSSISYGPDWSDSYSVRRVSRTYYRLP